MFAIIRVQGKQYLVSKGDILEVDKMDVKKEEVVNLNDVLVYMDDKETKIGQPRVSGATVSAKVLEPLKKGEKVDILKFKAKKRYTKRQGFRPQYTVLEIQNIECK